MPSKCSKHNSLWSSDFWIYCIQQLEGIFACSDRHQVFLKRLLFYLTLSIIVNVKYMETVEYELFIMLEEVFCVLLFVWYEGEIVCLLSSGTLM